MLNDTAMPDDSRSHRPDGRAAPCGWTPPSNGKRQRILYFTKTVGYEHSAVRRDGGAMSHSEQVLSAMGDRVGLKVECTKDGRVFDGDLDRFDAIAFYTLGDLTRAERSPSEPISQAGKRRLLEAIAAGKPFIGFHSAADTFYGESVDPYIRMVGAEFCGHGLQQEAALRVTSPGFPGLEGMNGSLRFFEEWYCFKRMSRQMHVIMSLETSGMQGNLYDRPPMPSTWARRYGDGRVFYTSLGHREDVWDDARFQQIAYAGLAWALGNVDADVSHNFETATPDGDFYRKQPLEPGTIAR